MLGGGVEAGSRAIANAATDRQAGLYLNVAISADGNGKDDRECMRRDGQGSAPWLPVPGFKLQRRILRWCVSSLALIDARAAKAAKRPTQEAHRLSGQLEQLQTTPHQVGIGGD